MYEHESAGGEDKKMRVFNSIRISMKKGASAWSEIVGGIQLSNESWCKAFESFARVLSKALRQSCSRKVSFWKLCSKIRESDLNSDSVSNWIWFYIWPEFWVIGFPFYGYKYEIFCDQLYLVENLWLLKDLLLRPWGRRQIVEPR